MRILILEDMIPHQVRMEKTLTSIAQELGIDIQIKITGKITEFKRYIENDEVNQLYFLDIDIKGESTKGLEIAQFIRNHNPYAIIVFVTSKSEFATMTFKYKVSALDFIDKDINDAAFRTRIKDAIIYTKNTLIANTNMVDYFDYSYRGSEVRMPYNDILYIETSGSSHKLRIIGKNFIKEFYGTIMDIQEKDRETNRFFCPHKSYLVNISNIFGYDKKTREIILYEDHRCPITRMKVKYLREILKVK